MTLIFGILKLAFYALQFYFLFYSYHLFLSTGLAAMYKLKKKKPAPATDTFARIAIMLPAYKASAQFLNVIEACRAQNYPRERFDVFALLQHCSPEMVMAVKQKGVIVFEQEFDKSKGNPYLHALNYFIRAIENHASHLKYDAVLLVDKDNLLAEDFLDLTNRGFQQGRLAIQGRRRPLNLDTSAACFDHVAEVSNDQVLRAAKAALGLSAEISGSGMVFGFELYKKAIAAVDLQSPVHDKTFLLALLKLGAHVFYEPDAVLYEEKTASYQAISQQRTRWIGGQFYLCKKYFLKLIFLGIKQRRLDPVDYAITLLKIPRSLHVAGLLFWIGFAFILPTCSLIPSWHWLLYLTGYFISIILLLLIGGAPLIVYKALLRAPAFIYSLLKSTCRSFAGKIHGGFIHTEHSKVVSLTDLTKKR